MTLGQLYIKYKFCLTFHYKLEFSGNNPSYILKAKHLFTGYFKHQENESFIYQEALFPMPSSESYVPLDRIPIKCLKFLSYLDQGPDELVSGHPSPCPRLNRGELKLFILKPG